MYEGRLLNNEYIDPDADPSEVEEPVEETTESYSHDDLDEESPVELVYDPEVHEIVNPDRGEWYMDKDGEHLIKLEAKEAKRLRKKLESVVINPDAVIEE